MTVEARLISTQDLDSVRLLTLQRPERLNAFTQGLYDAFTAELLRADGDSGVGAIVVTGSGRAFCAGADLEELQERGDFRNQPDAEHGFEGMAAALMTLSKPLVCAVNGLAVGLGVTLLAHADLVVMSSQARVRCPFTELGLGPELASSALLSPLMGHQNAAWVLFSSEWLDAAECLKIGLAWQVAEPDEVLQVAIDRATSIARHPVTSLVATKRLLLAARADAVEAALRRESEAFDELLVRFQRPRRSVR